MAYGKGERNKWDLYPANDLSEGPLARGWSAALCGYTLAPEASLTQITNEAPKDRRRKSPASGV